LIGKIDPCIQPFSPISFYNENKDTNFKCRKSANIKVRAKKLLEIQNVDEIGNMSAIKTSI